MGRDAFIADAWAVVGRRVSKERLLSDIYDTAASSVGLPVEPDSDAVAMFRMVLAEGRSLIEQRNRIEARAVELLAEHPDYRLLVTIPGIGPVNALTILAEAGDLRRFGHHRQFLKFCGMDLATIRSGTFRGQTKLSKYGNARLRRTLWMAGQVAIMQRANSFRDKFERYIARDGTMPTCGARRTQPSPPRWRAPLMRSSKAANPIVPSSRGRCTAEGPFSHEAVETPPDRR